MKVKKIKAPVPAATHLKADLMVTSKAISAENTAAATPDSSSPKRRQLLAQISLEYFNMTSRDSFF